MSCTEYLNEAEVATKLEWEDLTEPPTWQYRLIQERVDLEYALRRLNKFIESAEFKNLSGKDRGLLERQQTLMEQLYEVLGRRICNMEV